MLKETLFPEFIVAALLAGAPVVSTAAEADAEASGNSVTTPILLPENDPLWQGRAFEVQLRIEPSGQLVRGRARVVNTAARTTRGNPSLVSVRLRDYAGDIIEEHHDWDPRMRFEMSGDGEHVYLANEGEAVLLVPYDPNAAEVEVRAIENGTVVFVDSVVDVAADYCEVEPSTAPCGTDLIARVMTTDEAFAGEPFSYVIGFQNLGDNPAHLPRLQADWDPPATSAVITEFPNISCQLLSAPQAGLGCETLVLPAGASASFDVTLTADAASVFDHGRPIVLSLRAQAETPAGHDVNVANNTDSALVRVFARADLSVEILGTYDVPPLAVSGEPTLITIAYSAVNHGRASPMLAAIGAVAGDVATGRSQGVVAPQILSLAVGYPASGELPFEVICLQAGVRDVPVSIAIEPWRPDDIDHSPENNVASASTQLRCAQHAVIIVKPGESEQPAPINLDAHGVIPVGVVSSPGLLNASSVIWETVRFGSHDALISDVAAGTAAPRHSAPHFEDVNKDGILDLMAHFDTQLAGLTPQDEQACVRGHYLDVDGQPQEFFGCGAVRAFSHGDNK